MKTKISIEWSIEDVKSQNKSLTDEQCRDVLEILERNHDANIGINWDVIKYRIDYYLKDKRV